MQLCDLPMTSLSALAFSVLARKRQDSHTAKFTTFHTTALLQGSDTPAGFALTDIWELQLDPATSTADLLRTYLLCLLNLIAQLTLLILIA